MVFPRLSCASRDLSTPISIWDSSSMALAIKIICETGSATILAEGADMDRLGGNACTVEVIDGEDILGKVSCPRGLDRGTLFEILASAEGKRWPDSIRIAYTSGDCDILAVAFDRVLKNGQIVGVTDPLDEDWEPVEGAPYLVHAGYLVGGTVYDVEGTTPIEAWTARWGALGSLECSLECLTRETMERMQSETMSEDRIVKAEECARLIGLVATLFPEPEDIATPAFA